MSKTKKCSKCGETKELNDFFNLNRTEDGKNSQCKICFKAYMLKWRKNNNKKISDGKRRYRENNKEKISVEYAEYCKNNKEKILAKAIEKYKKNPEITAKYLLIRKFGHDIPLPEAIVDARTQLLLITRELRKLENEEC
jgi:ribosomal protein L32